MLGLEKRIYRLTGITPILGSQPAQADIRQKYILSKAPTQEQLEAEAKMTAEDIQADLEEKGLSVFLLDPSTGALSLMDYVIKGYLKEAIGTLKMLNGVTAHKKKVDGCIFSYSPEGDNPDQRRFLRFKRDGEYILDDDEINERVLRADTAMGPRTTLVGSEQIDTPWTLDVELQLLPTSGKGNITWDVIEQAFEYGEQRGLGQWRNAGWGRFTFELIEKGASK